MEENKKKDYLLPVSILISGILISGSLVYLVSSQNRAGDSRLTAQINRGENSADLEAVLALTSRDVILGDPKAPVTLIEYGDYQCPFCARFFSDTESLLRDEYVKTGKVKMIYRDFPLESIHPYARSAAEASRCAKDQSKYWLYHDALFERQDEIPTLDFVKLARELGLETSSFRTCVENRAYKDEVEQDFEGGTAAGVRGTPTTFVNGEVLVGALPYSDFKNVIDKFLTQNQ